MTEEAVIDLCRSQDRKGQKVLYDTYSGQMYSICLRYCKDAPTAADALQNAFISVFKNFSSFEGNGKIKYWIKTIVIRSCLDEIRKHKRYVFTEDETEFEDLGQSFEQEMAFDQYDAKHILNLVRKLPEGYRIVFSMHVLDELSHKEISQHLKISESTSRTQLLRARKMLQKMILGDNYLTQNYSIHTKRHSA